MSSLKGGTGKHYNSNNIWPSRPNALYGVDACASAHAHISPFFSKIFRISCDVGTNLTCNSVTAVVNRLTKGTNDCKVES